MHRLGIKLNSSISAFLPSEYQTDDRPCDSIVLLFGIFHAFSKRSIHFLWGFSLENCQAMLNLLKRILMHCGVNISI